MAAAGPASAPAAPMLCVSIHDVAPATWSDCLRLVQAVREVADIPLTWLVVPNYHFRPERSPAMEACLKVVVERGDELALHGFSHLDTEAGGGGLRGRFLRNVYTRREGEFAALDEAEAQRRIALGLEWFAERGWTPSGFIPPAWLLGKGAWRALRASAFAYTTTFSHFHCLAGGEAARGRAVLSPSLVYAARNRGGRLLSPRVADATAAMLANAPLVRFSLHPPDARYPDLMRHTQRMLERLLAQREAVTKAECARRLMQPPVQPAPRETASQVVLPLADTLPVPAAEPDLVAVAPAAPEPATQAVTIDASSEPAGVDAVELEAKAEPGAETQAEPSEGQVSHDEGPSLAADEVIQDTPAPPLDATAPASPDDDTSSGDAHPPPSPSGDAGKPRSADFRSPHRVVPTFASRPGDAAATSANPTSPRASDLRPRRRRSSPNHNAATHPSR